MKVQDRIKEIDGVDFTAWDGKERKLSVYCQANKKEAVKIKVAAELRQADVIDSIDKIILVS